MFRFSPTLLLVAFSLLALGLAGCGDAAGTANKFDAGTMDTSDGTGVDTGDTSDTPCNSNMDCGNGTVCVFIARVSGGYDQICAAPVGDGRPGAACTMDGDCQNGLCLDLICVAPCTTNMDCPDGSTCEMSNGLNVCIPQPDACSANADCTEAGDVCLVDRSGDMVDLTCGAPVGGGTLGTACTTDSECENNLCLGGACTLPCERRDDCSMDGSSICRADDVTTGTGSTATLNVCQEPDPTQCSSDSACTAPQRCVADRGNTELRFACGDPNTGGGESGAGCIGDADCAQNLCINNLCAGPCESVGADCPGSEFACDLVDVDLGGGLTDQADLCIAPIPCTDDGACLLSEVCYVDHGQSDVTFVCEEPNTGGANPGQLCGTDVDCASNLCFEGRFQDVCTNPCDDPGDCDQGYECVNGTLLATDGTQVTRMFCQPVAPTPCTSQNDCGAGAVCAIVENVAATGLESVCIPNSGGSATGAMCGADNECSSLVCLGANCSIPCTNTNQCAAGQVCRNNNISKSGLNGMFEVCETLPDLQCTSSGDCTDGVRECGDLRFNPAQIYCSFPNAGQGGLGTSCAADGDCFSGLCADFSSNECSVGCANNGDCGAGQICTSYHFNMNEDPGMCARACADNDDCSGGNPGNICSVNSNWRDDTVDRICELPSGMGDIGAACTTGNECITGLCLTTYQYNGTPCTSNAQCTGGTTCEFVLNGMGQQCATTTQNCTALCDDGTDCIGPMGNPLTACSSGVTIGSPVSGTPIPISTCARP